MRKSFENRSIFITLLLFFSLLFYPFEAMAENWSSRYLNEQRNQFVESSDNPDLKLKSTMTPSLYNFKTPLYENGVFYFSENSRASTGYNIFAKSKVTGEILWNFSQSSGTLGSVPLIHGDYLILSGSTLVCLNKKTGSLVWEVSNLYKNFFYQDAIVIDDNIFVRHRNDFTSGTIFKFDLNGQRDSIFQIEAPGNFFPLGRVDNDLLITYYDTSYNGHLERYATDGTLKWHYGGAGYITGPAVVSNNRAYLQFNGSYFTVIDLALGIEMKRDNTVCSSSMPVIVGSHAYFIGSSQYATPKGGNGYLMDYNLVTGLSEIKKTFNNFRFSSTSTIIAVGSYLYFTNEKGVLFKYSIKDNSLKELLINDTVVLGEIIYADGVFIVMSGDMKTMYFLSDVNYSATAGTEITIDSPYVCNDCNQYLGQLHDHYVPDVPWFNDQGFGDAGYYPSYTVNKYRDLGYDFIAVTEHNQMEIMPVTTGILQLQHAEESTQGWGKHHLLAIGTSEQIDSSKSDQDRVNAIVSQGGIPIFAHPDSWFYGAFTKTIARLKNLHHIEIFNYAVGPNFLTKIQQDAIDDFDDLLSYYGKDKYYLTAGDDYTPGIGSPDHASVTVNAKTNNQSSVMQALKTGDFYASEGSSSPKISISNTKDTITVKSDKLSKIIFIGRGGGILSQSIGLEATYKANGNEGYIRMEVIALENNKTSWTQPLYVNVKQTTSVGSGNHLISLQGAEIDVNSDSDVNAGLVPKDKYPEEFPSQGYLSSVYSVSSDTAKSGYISIDYDESKISTNENNLTVYQYDESKKSWQSIETVLEKDTDKAIAAISDSDQYVLSAQSVDDTVPPIINSVFPTNLAGLQSKTTVTINVSDNDTVRSVSFGIDGKFYSTDSDRSDGFTVIIDPSKLISGNHKLQVVVEDFSRNQTTAEYIFSTISAIDTLEIQTVSPVSSDYLTGSSTIYGSFRSSFSIESIGVFIDNIFIDNAEINYSEKSYEKVMDWNSVSRGEHQLKIVLTDVQGNITETTQKIVVEPMPTVEIVSPLSKSYYQSDNIALKINIFPVDAKDITVSLDNKILTNYNRSSLSNLAIGKHTVVVKRGNETLASREFSIIKKQNSVGISSKFNSSKIVGVPVGVVVKFSIIEISHAVGNIVLERKNVNEVQKYINKFSKQKTILNQYLKNILKR